MTQKSDLIESCRTCYLIGYSNYQPTVNYDGWYFCDIHSSLHGFSILVYFLFKRISRNYP